jgi:lipopolysaccharide/colanic/teichoic acid biosynthesis glycosyltransferase
MTQGDRIWLEEEPTEADTDPLGDEVRPESQYPSDTFAYLFTKRVIDLILSSVAILLSFPFMLIIGLIIFIDDPHASPVFAQARTGKNGRVFRLFKFRSMYANAEQIKAQLMEQNEMSGPVFKIKDDPRVTKIGHFIRRTSIDELPQFINIWLGDMSLVGPRPLPVAEASAVSGIGKVRELVKPGLTCIWQVSGRNNIDFEEWMKLDALYVRKHNLWIDFKLMIQTIPAVLLTKGAS